LAPAVYAQAATSLEQAELAGLNPATRAEVQARMAKGGQKVEEVLTTILLNNIKLKHQASQIVAIDFDRGVAVVNEPGGTMHMYHFNTKTLEPS
jgi:hypothetical protein